jgi:hypothetical protein
MGCRCSMPEGALAATLRPAGGGFDWLVLQ